MAFEATCSCGHKLTFDAATREGALAMIKAGMTQDALSAHWQERHGGAQPMPTLDQVHAMLGQSLKPA